MVTGDFWDVTNPSKPFGVIDPDEQLSIPFDWAEFLTQEDGTYVSHTITAQSGITVVSSAHSAGVITALVKATDPDEITIGAKYFLICSIVITAGGLTIKKDQTVYLKIGGLVN
jgi:hypothetical protein